jgi:hypothetical protein
MIIEKSCETVLFSLYTIVTFTAKFGFIGYNHRNASALCKNCEIAQKILFL